MKLLKEIGNGLLTIIQWVGMVYSAFCDWLGISEWTVLLTCITIIAVIVGVIIYKKR